ncbi:MAG: MltA domain-containing protein [Deltaproteobacteria bacterium]|nr:MltA domain-containing protein [Deltaproteobacteria bacterium]MBW1960585.1 MltA domain-containing protein [Deltaproteobacteria bacterium]MBW1994667.1 MltA domain-containing protein [Deltaproteobacteria bacterium]MBW2150888.1 MltA domain-containing protein [Deltaproteobacteria bacterium]
MILRGKKAILCITLALQILVLFNFHPARCQANQPHIQALEPIQVGFPKFRDDLGFKLLALAIRRNLSYLERLDPDHVFFYGPDQIACHRVIDTQMLFLKILSSRQPLEQLNKEIRRRFKIYRAAGTGSDRKVLFTGYYEPVYDAALKPNDIYKYPIYRKPRDLVRVDLSLFDAKYGNESIVARIKNNQVLPYYTRFEIEIEKVLEGKNLEIAWLKDPMDVYLLHIEGAGRLKLPGGQTILVSYDTSNGRPYRSFGKYLLENGLLTRSELSIKRIRQYLSRHPAALTAILRHNDSYVFFKQVREGPLGSIDVPLTGGRSLALDAALFPKGALAFMSSKKPVVNRQGEIAGWSKFSRFVLNQDTGYSIKGPGRADLFWGNDHKAETIAWRFTQQGDLYILIKKP